MKKKIKEILMVIFYLFKNGDKKERFVYSLILFGLLTFVLKNVGWILPITLIGIYLLNKKNR